MNHITFGSELGYLSEQAVVQGAGHPQKSLHGEILIEFLPMDTEPGPYESPDLSVLRRGFQKSGEPVKRDRQGPPILKIDDETVLSDFKATRAGLSFQSIRPTFCGTGPRFSSPVP